MKVAQSWDDGVVDDARLTELLRRHGATGTFNLNPGLHQRQRSYSWTYGHKEVWRLGQAELSAVYAGFEIANHSTNHPNLPDLSPAELAREIGDSRRLLQEWFQQPVRGFCYPFGTFNAAVKDAVRAAGHGYARTVTERDLVLPPADPLELGVSCLGIGGELPVRRSRVLEPLRTSQGQRRRIPVLGPQLRVGRRVDVG